MNNNGRLRRLVALLCLAALSATTSTAGAAQRGPSVGTPGEEVDPSSVDGGSQFEDFWAIPLKGERPSWYTPQLHERTLAAAGSPVAAPTDAPLPSEVGIRPGSWMISPSGCTMNFVFQKNGGYAIGTAGHCAKGGQQVTLLTLAPGTNNPVLVNIGKVSISKDGGVGNDFALVPINPTLNSWVFPTTALVGGPCGSFSGSDVQTVWHYGHGLGIGAGGTPREGIALGWKADAFGFASPAIYGDSGSPVRVTDLKAAGNLTHLLIFVGKFPSTWLKDWAGTGSVIGGTRIGKMLSIATGWSLVNSPLCF